MSVPNRPDAQFGKRGITSTRQRPDREVPEGLMWCSKFIVEVNLLWPME